MNVFAYLSALRFALARGLERLVRMTYESCSGVLSGLPRPIRWGEGRGEGSPFRASALELRPSFGLRISDFGLPSNSFGTQTKRQGARGRRRWAALLLLSGSSLLASAQSTNAPAMPGAPASSPARLDYPAFRIIPERNIFNPHRYARSGPAPRRERSRTARVDSCALVGVMTYEKGPFAFFDGSSSEYRKVLKPEETIAGYKVTAIKPASVLLAGETNTLELRVGMQLRREEGGQWQIAAAPQLAPLSPPPATAPRPVMAPAVAQAGLSSAEPDAMPQEMSFDPATQTVVAEPPPPPAEGSATGAAPDAAAGGSDDPVLRRLMQRREQEMNR